MDWLEALQSTIARAEPCVLVTVTQVRGHAPRDAGAKMLVRASNVIGSVGGGNLEEIAVRKARAFLETRAVNPEMLVITLGTQPGEHGVQCCGGEVTLLLEPFTKPRPQVAIFGVGHVGLALTRVLSVLELELLLYDSRAKMLEASRFEDCSRTAQRRLFHYPHPAPEFVFAELRQGAVVLILTHDHREDIAILETALHRPDLRFIGLIGSSAKWSTFKQQLGARGFTDSDFARVTTPIGVPGVSGKEPEVIAIAVAAQVLQVLETQSDAQ
jgi:xanthine dehydrogenase accessory factor